MVIPLLMMWCCALMSAGNHMRRWGGGRGDWDGGRGNRGGRRGKGGVGREGGREGAGNHMRR